MKKNLLSSIFVFGLILLGLFMLAGCKLETKVAAAAGQEGLAPMTHETTFSPEVLAFERYRAEQAAAGKVGTVYAVDPVDLKLFNAADPSPTNMGAEIDANTARWISLGERYSEDTVNSTRLATANVARWNAMGEHYQATALDDIELATKAFIARWDALGERYSEDTVNSTRVATANAARWNAMGEHYQATALDDIELAAKAYIDRWVALGEQYRTEETVAVNLAD
jgi:hypothetical protein